MSKSRFNRRMRLSPGIYTSEYIVKVNGDSYEASIGLPLGKNINMNTIINFTYLFGENSQYQIVSENGEKIIRE